MEFFNSAVGVLQTLVVALGAGLGIWGVINLLEGYGQDNLGFLQLLAHSSFTCFISSVACSKSPSSA